MPKTNMKRKRRRLGAFTRATCHYCNTPCRDGAGSVEHIVPKSLGGKNDDANCVLACKTCNRRRGSEGRPCDCSKCSAAWARHDAENAPLYVKGRVTVGSCGDMEPGEGDEDQ